MTKDKTTEASSVELTDEALDGAQGGAGFLKLGDIEGESKEASLNFSKVEFEYVKVDPKLVDKSSTKFHKM